MTGAMPLGMCVLGMAFRGVHLAVFGSGFDEAWHDRRGHSWERGGEMAAAMFALALALFWMRITSAHVVLPLEMALMIPALIVVMLYRIDEYVGHSPTPDWGMFSRALQRRTRSWSHTRGVTTRSGSSG